MRAGPLGWVRRCGKCSAAQRSAAQIKECVSTVSPAEVLPSFVGAYQCRLWGFGLANVFGSSQHSHFSPVSVWTCLRIFAVPFAFYSCRTQFPPPFSSRGQAVSPYFPRSAAHRIAQCVDLLRVKSCAALINFDKFCIFATRSGVEPDPEPQKTNPIYQVGATNQLISR